MPRDLSNSARNEFKITDPQTGDTVTFFYQTPTASVFAAYESAQYKKAGNKMTFNPVDPPFNFGMKILTGISEDSFVYDGKPISSDPNSPNFREDWKTLVGEVAADLVRFFGRYIFGGATLVKDSGIEIESSVVAEDVIPLGKN